MLERLKNVFARVPEATPATNADRLRIATCVVLMEVARADDEFSAVERERIVAALRQRFALSEAEAQELIETSAGARSNHHDLWHFTHTINEASSPDEKRQIIEEVWRVIYADKTLDAHEDYLVHKLAKLLNLNHPQLIEAKMAVKGEQGPAAD